LAGDKNPNQPKPTWFEINPQHFHHRHNSATIPCHVRVLRTLHSQKDIHQMQLPQIYPTAQAIESLMIEIWDGKLTESENGETLITGSALYDDWHNARTVAKHFGLIRIRQSTWSGYSNEDGKSQRGNVYRCADETFLDIMNNGSAVKVRNS
jgi:hypothetical protein